MGQASELIHEYSQDITRAIGEINEGMEEQSRHAQECVEKTDILSNEIQEVSHVVERVEKLVGETEGMINKGMEIVQVLGCLLYTSLWQDNGTEPDGEKYSIGCQ